MRVLKWSLEVVSRRRLSISAALSTQERPRNSYWHNPGKYPLSHQTIGNLVDEAAAKWPDREAVVTLWSKASQQGREDKGRESMTFMEAKEKADRLAAAFVKILGMQRGDRLAIWGSNSMEWYITQMAAAKSGLVLVNVNPAYYEKELRYCLKKVGARAILAADKHRTRRNSDIMEGVVPRLSASARGGLISEDLPALKSVVVIGDEKWKGTFHFDELMENVTESQVEEVRHQSHKVQPDEGCNIQFTSGTTGEPNGALLSHHNIINNAESMGHRAGLEDKHHKICFQVPLFHCFGCVVGTVASLHSGTTLVMPAPNFDTKASLRALTEEKCTVLYGTPTMYVDLLEQHRRQGMKRLVKTEGWEGVEVAVSGGAPCPEHLFRQLMDTFGVKRVCSIYGMTETSPISFQTTPNDTLEQMLKTVGFVSEHVEVKVVNPDGEMVPMGTPGELWVRGYCNMIGYWGDDHRTKETIGEDRWLRTGDQFVLMENGYGRIVGRIKDMIIRGGENIFPKEIEEFLHSHPSIAEVQVFGIPDDRLGEIVCTWVRCKKGMVLTADELRAFCQGKISHFKIPKYIKFVEDFPKTVSGKIQKFRIQEIMAKELQGED